MSNLIQSNSSEGVDAAQGSAQQFLKLQLYPETKAMLPISQITEVLKIQFGQIVPIPQMPTWVMGVYNWRGEILWMVDLGHLVGLDTWYQHQVHGANYTAIVLSPYRNQTDHLQSNLGLVVPQVEDLETCTPGAIQSTLGSTVSARLDKFLQGYYLKPDGEIILALKAHAIATAMPSHPS
ncbi:MAG: chemotaxis protein CheW [Cyanobacteria bacterium P01_A01_bin.83]